MYGVGYPVMFKATAGGYALWFLIVLALGKILATSLTMGIGGSGGIFAPSLFIGVTAGYAYGDIVNHIFGTAAGPPALYAVIAMGAVFTSAARAPLTSLASVVEMTGDFSLTLPVMLALAIATAVSRALSYGTIYTTKLLRRGHDIDQATSRHDPEVTGTRTAAAEAQAAADGDSREDAEAGLHHRGPACAAGDETVC
jgi:CIC family chloride channel protein